MPKGVPKNGVNAGWFKKGNKPVFTPERNKLLSEKLKGREFSEEHKRHLSESKKSSRASQIATAKLNASKKGVPLSEEHKRKIGEAGKGRRLSEEAKRKIGDTHRNKVVSEEARHKMSLAKTGKDGNNKGNRNGNWRGGITPLKKSLRDLHPYKEWRLGIFNKDNYTCQICNTRGGCLEVDHKKPLALILYENDIVDIKGALLCGELWDSNNGQTLCKDCHRKKTSTDMILLCKTIPRGKKYGVQYP